MTQAMRSIRISGAVILESLLLIGLEAGWVAFCLRLGWRLAA